MNVILDVAKVQKRLQHIDLEAPMKWAKRELIKDILALNSKFIPNIQLGWSQYEQIQGNL